jgi:hypothetical protein
MFVRHLCLKQPYYSFWHEKSVIWEISKENIKKTDKLNGKYQHEIRNISCLTNDLITVSCFFHKRVVCTKFDINVFIRFAGTTLPAMITNVSGNTRQYGFLVSYSVMTLSFNLFSMVNNLQCSVAHYLPIEMVQMRLQYLGNSVNT